MSPPKKPAASTTPLIDTDGTLVAPPTAASTYIALTAEERLATQVATEGTASPTGATNAPEPGLDGLARPSTQSGFAQRLTELAAHNRAATQAQLANPQHSLVGRDTVRYSNLPTQTPAGVAILEQERVAREARRAASDGKSKALKKRWVKIGVQPASGGYVLHTEHWEGDVKVRETVQRNLSPLAAREKLALHMAALYAIF